MITKLLFLLLLLSLSYHHHHHCHYHNHFFPVTTFPAAINFSTSHYYNTTVTLAGQLYNHNIIIKYSQADHLLIQEKIHQDLIRLKMADREGQVGREVLVGHVSTPLGVPATVETAMTAMLTAEGTFLTMKPVVQCRHQETSS
jgi:hypothetical protein